MRKDLKEIYDANLRDFGHLSQTEIVALTLWAECRGESLAGKISVGTVIMNRVDHRLWDGDTYQDVCLWPKQFSCFNPSDIQRERLVDFAEDRDFSFENSRSLKECLRIATGLLTGTIQPDKEILNSGCCQYLTTKAKNHCEWWKKMRFVKKIGAHEFYTDLIIS